MQNLKDRFLRIPKTHLMATGILLLMFLALALLWFNNATSSQASGALVAQVHFEGEYRIGDEPWQTIIPGEHISST